MSLPKKRLFTRDTPRSAANPTLSEEKHGFLDTFYSSYVSALENSVCVP